ncbi:MAG: SUMF1/EgtB/PvdO family nonheme iron enzyme, partial [Acidobacteriota bacterium]
MATKGSLRQGVILCHARTLEALRTQGKSSYMFNPEDIIDLAEQLRAARFNIGLQQHIAAQDLMLVLVANGHLPEDPRKWKSLLSPIFCSNPTEQEQFAQHFDSWLSRRPKLVELAAQAEQADQPTPTETIQPKQPLTVADLLRWIRLHPAWSVAAVLLLSALLVGVLTFRLDRKLEGQVFSQTEGNPLPGAEVTFLNKPTTTDKDGRFSIAYQIRVYEWLSTVKFERVQIGKVGYFPEYPDSAVQRPGQISATLEKREDLKPVVNPIQPIPEPVAQTPPPVVQPEQRSAKWRSLLIALIPLALFVLWMLWRWIRRRMVLRKLEVSGTPRLHRLSFKREDVPLFSSSPFRRAAQELRRHRHIQHHELDVAATVGATIRKGYFTPSYSKRRSLPEYLLLIDRASMHDGQARVAEELALRLEADGVLVDRFYFQGDARTCRAPEPPLSPVYTLHELSARYPDHRLLVFSDGEGFFDPFTAEPGRWLEQFDYWQHRALLTPESPAAWGYREFTLAEQHGFVLIPAKITGLAALGELLNIGLMTEPPDDEDAPFPALAADNARRMLDSRAPKPEVIEQLCDQARAYLGEEGWLWLMACAVYPQVKWEITLYLGGRLFGIGSGSDHAVRQAASLSGRGHQTNRLPAETSTSWQLVEQANDWSESVLRLVRLPWFRYGKMPDWLRERLIADFQPEQEANIRKIIADLLRKVLTNPLEPLTLEFAEAEKPTERWKAFWQRALERFKQWRQRRELYRLLQAQDEESPLRDFVFLSFLAGQSRKRLSVNPPDLLRRMLFNEGVAALGFRAVTAGVAAVAMAGMLMFALWPKPPQLPKPEELLATNSPTPTVTPAETVTPTPATSRTPKPTPTGNRTPTPALIGTPVYPVDIGQTTAQTGQAVFTVSETPTGYSVNLGKGVTLELVSLKGGPFTMGGNRYDWEKPPHRVQVSPFAMGKFEVTQAQWMAVMDGKNPSRFKGDNLLVENVSSNDAQQFIERLNKMTYSQQFSFSLPTEAEWEYACRAGTTTEFAFGDSISSDQANFDGNYPYGNAKKS